MRRLKAALSATAARWPASGATLARRAGIAVALLAACPKAAAQPQFEASLHLLALRRDGSTRSTPTGLARKGAVEPTQSVFPQPARTATSRRPRTVGVNLR
jgi:hypothetical protein